MSDTTTVADQTPQESAPTQPIPAPPTTCRCGLCGYVNTLNPLLDNKPITASEEEVKEFLRASIGGRPYQKTYRLFGGQASVTFQSFTVEQSAHVSYLMNNISITDTPTAKTDAYAIKFGMAIVALNDKPLAPVPADRLDTPINALKALYYDRFGAYDEGMLAVYIQAFGQFERLTSILVASAFDRTFWEGAGLG